MAKTVPVPLTPPGGGHFALDRLHRRVEHLHVGDAHDLDVAQLAEGPAGVVVRIPLRIVWRPVLVVEQRVGDAAVGLVHAQDVAAGGERPRLGLARLVRRGLLLVLRARARRRRRAAVADAASLVISRAGRFLPGIVTVNGAVAREISQPCSCRMRSSSACGPGRGSSPGNT